MTESSRSTSSVAYEALNLGKANKQAMEAHEDLCAERYGNIHAAIGRIEGILKWAGVTGFGVIITLLGFLLAQQVQANDRATKDSAAKIELLQRQLTQQQAPVLHPTPQP